jgi:potassium large conductance calcium-activated channel subfamily M alpha protein 1
VCLQVLQPSSKDLYFNSLAGNDTDQVICVDELKLYLLAKTCLCPGINTLISFLIQSTKPSYDVSKYDRESENWIDDYLNGMQNEIYRVPLE